MTTNASIIAISRHRFLVDGEDVTTIATFHVCPIRCKYCVNHQCQTMKTEMFKKLQDFIEDIKGQYGDITSIEGAKGQEKLYIL